MIHDIEHRKMLTDETIHLACSILCNQFKGSIDGLNAPLAVAYGARIAKDNFYNPMNDKYYIQIMYTGSKNWVTMVFRKGKTFFLNTLKKKHNFNMLCGFELFCFGNCRAS